jgi:uncharacterized protein DUF6059
MYWAGALYVPILWPEVLRTELARENRGEPALGTAQATTSAENTTGLDEPPHGHPERLALDAPASPAERELWADIEDIAPGRHQRTSEGP